MEDFTVPHKYDTISSNVKVSLRIKHSLIVYSTRARHVLSIKVHKDPLSLVKSDTGAFPDHAY